MYYETKGFFVLYRSISKASNLPFAFVAIREDVTFQKDQFSMGQRLSVTFDPKVINGVDTTWSLPFGNVTSFLDGP